MPFYELVTSPRHEEIESEVGKDKEKIRRKVERIRYISSTRIAQTGTESKAQRGKQSPSSCRYDPYRTALNLSFLSREAS
jgi:hypothetical protein